MLGLAFSKVHNSFSLHFTDTSVLLVLYVFKFKRCEYQCSSTESSAFQYPGSFSKIWILIH